MVEFENSVETDRMIEWNCESGRVGLGSPSLSASITTK